MTEIETLFNGRYLRMMRRGSWEYAERVNPGGAVIIVAVTDQDEVLFVEQFRVPVQAPAIEMPAGLIGDTHDTAGENVLQTAQRELEEETGLSCALRQLQLLGLFLPDAGLIEARVALFAARGVQPKPGVRQAEREAGTGELHWFSREALQRLAQSAGDIGGSTLVACLRWLLAPAAARGDNAHP